MGPFDEYVSLGGNCEVAFQMRRALGRDQSGICSWWFMDLPALLALLRDGFRKILMPNNLIPWPGHMVRDTAYGYCFHSPFEAEQPIDDPNFADLLAEHREKVEHLKGRFYRPSGRRVYFLKLVQQPLDGELAELVSHLRTIGADFALVVLTVEPMEADLGPEVHFRTLERFAPIEAAQDGHEPSWDRIFAEFPHTALATV